MFTSDGPLLELVLELLLGLVDPRLLVLAKAFLISAGEHIKVGAGGRGEGAGLLLQ